MKFHRKKFFRIFIPWFKLQSYKIPWKIKKNSIIFSGRIIFDILSTEIGEKFLEHCETQIFRVERYDKSDTSWHRELAAHNDRNQVAPYPMDDFKFPSIPFPSVFFTTRGKKIKIPLTR